MNAVGSARLAKFLGGFNGELPPALAQILAALSDQPAKDPMPPPEVAADDALNTLPALARPSKAAADHSPRPLVALADLLASKPLLPERLRLALFALEAAAAPDNQARLDDAIARRIPSAVFHPAARWIAPLNSGF